MQGGPVDELLDMTVERPVLDQLQVEVGRTLEDRVHSGLTGDDREERHLHAVDQAGGHQRPVHRQAAVRAQRHLGLLLEPGDDVDGVTAHDGRIRPVERAFQRGRHHGCRHAPHPGDPWVTDFGLLGARSQHPREQPIRVGPEDHALLRAVRGEAVVEQLGALLAPVAGPVGAGGAVAVEAGKDVEGVGRGHVGLLESSVCADPGWSSVDTTGPLRRSHRSQQLACDKDLRHRIAAVPFTLRNLKQDLEDVGSRFDGAPDLEFRLASEALELEQSGLSYQRVPPGYRFPYGHTHRKQEEVYVVLRGSGRMKLDDEIVELKEWDAVRVPPGTWRGYEAGPKGLEILVIGAPNLGEDPPGDVDGRRGWWAD